MTLASGAFFVGEKAVVPHRPLDLLAFGLVWIGQAQEGQQLNITSAPAVVRTGAQDVVVPVHLLMGWGREAIKAEIAAHVDRLFDAVEEKATAKVEDKQE